jgi:hypothetical protein
LWHEGFVLGGDLQTFGQQHFSMWSGQLLLSSAGFKLALSRSPESVAPELKATNTTAATTILKIRCILHMLKPEAQRNKDILAQFGQLRTSLLASVLRLGP